MPALGRSAEVLLCPKPAAAALAPQPAGAGQQAGSAAHARFCVPPGHSLTWPLAATTPAVAVPPGRAASRPEALPVPVPPTWARRRPVVRVLVLVLVRAEEPAPRPAAPAVAARG